MHNRYNRYYNSKTHFGAIFCPNSKKMQLLLYISWLSYSYLNLLFHKIRIPEILKTKRNPILFQEIS